MIFCNSLKCPAMRFWYEVLMSRHGFAACAAKTNSCCCSSENVYPALLPFHTYCCFYLVHWLPTPHTVWGLLPVRFKFLFGCLCGPRTTNPVWVQHIPPNQWKGFICQVCPHISLTGNLSSCFEFSDPFNRSNAISLQFEASKATLLNSTQVNLWLIISNLNHPARGCQPSPRPL